ncbi:hypothetical protein BKA62DRAFT_710185 [Auriculariales sp. MPI-PUGE-AT-0066]|nr:hypothetical protein BKA62DRAFT_710185 [Auriculariales sp. MPI-PUGE-AT-0066]
MTTSPKPSPARRLVASLASPLTRGISVASNRRTNSESLDLGRQHILQAIPRIPGEPPRVIPKVPVIPWTPALVIGAGVNQHATPKESALQAFTPNIAHEQWVESAAVICNPADARDLLYHHVAPPDQHSFNLLPANFDPRAALSPWLSDLRLSMASFALVVEAHHIEDRVFQMGTRPPALDAAKMNVFKHLPSTLFKDHGFYFVAGEQRVASFVAVYTFNSKDLDQRIRCEEAAQTLASSIRFNGSPEPPGLSPEQVSCLYSCLKDIRVYEDMSAAGRTERRTTADMITGDLTRTVVERMYKWKQTHSFGDQPPSFALLHRYSEEVPQDVFPDVWMKTAPAIAELRDIVFDCSLRALNTVLADMGARRTLLADMGTLDIYLAKARRLRKRVGTVHAHYWLWLKSRCGPAYYPERLDGATLTIGLTDTNAPPGTVIRPAPDLLVNLRPKWLKGENTLPLELLIDTFHVVGWTVRSRSGRNIQDCVTVVRQGNEVSLKMAPGAVWWRGIEVVPFVVDDEPLRWFSRIADRDVNGPTRI